MKAIRPIDVSKAYPYPPRTSKGPPYPSAAKRYFIEMSTNLGRKLSPLPILSTPWLYPGSLVPISVPSSADEPYFLTPAFMLYAEEQCQRAMEEDPEISRGRMLPILGNQWNNLTRNEKAVYEQNIAVFEGDIQNARHSRAYRKQCRRVFSSHA
jgi:hypothetical protein